MALLELKNVEAGYGRIQILHGVSLDVGEKEVVAVIGPNGAGKSTTFKVIMGFINYLGGGIRFAGQDIVGLRPDQILGRGLAYVPQGRIVFRHMTVLENLEMGAYIERDKAKIRQAMEYVFTLFPRLEERQKQLAGTMSGGAQQMLAMGRSLMARPKMIMLDEPSLGLAPRFITLVFEKIVEMSRSGLTIMLVEQNAARALEISDRAYVLELGRNRYEGTGQDLVLPFLPGEGRGAGQSSPRFLPCPLSPSPLSPAPRERQGLCHRLRMRLALRGGDPPVAPDAIDRRRQREGCRRDRHIPVRVQHHRERGQD
ncbi:MAG: ABC transporter ATP-binding protein, partial [Candidatus Tectomicrobia bacterium]|nr:ABC transporter ATP-binding protein [Candidatus Tectomicrobia bacterium]